MFCSFSSRLLCLAIPWAAFVWSGEALGDPSCPIHVEPAQVDSIWREKAHEAEGIFAEQKGPDNDCRSIRIEVQPEGNALLTFTTKDGRIAVRLLHSAADIHPIVEALLVTLPVETPLEVPVSKTNTNTNTTTAHAPVAREKPNHQLLQTTPRPGPRMLLRVLTGIRLGVDSGVFAPAIGVQTTMQFEPWEIGIAGEWNPLHLPLVGSAPVGYSMRSFEGNFLVGRQFIRGTKTFRAGASLGITAVHEETDADPQTKGRVNVDAFQPRVGAYAGMVIPNDGRFRFYWGLQGDVALWGLRDNGTDKKNLPDLSRFGVGLCLGMEVAP